MGEKGVRNAITGVMAIWPDILIQIQSSFTAAIGI
jgi:hypothetical protein